MAHMGLRPSLQIGGTPFHRRFIEWTDQFNTPDAAPVTSPRDATTERGVGSSTYVQTDGTFAVANGVMAVGPQTVAPGWGRQIMYGPAMSLGVGDACVWKVTNVSAAGYTVIGPAGGTAAYSYLYPLALYVDSLYYDATAAGESYVMSVVKLTSGCAYCVDGNLVLVDTTLNRPTAVATFVLSNFDGTLTVDNVHHNTTSGWLPQVLASDSFNRANSTTLGNTDGAGFADSSLGDGLAWTETKGNWSINTNRLLAAAGVDNTIAVVDVSETEQLVKATFNLGVAGASAGVALRVKDDNEYWECRLNMAATNVEINEVSATGRTLRAFSTVAAHVAQSTDIQLNGGVIGDKMWVALSKTGVGAMNGTHYTLASAYNTMTKCGLCLDSADAAIGDVRFDDFVVFKSTNGFKDGT